ncbi:hypothetical protein DKY63_01675 [Pseudomonas putida]|uniref:Uncharacterized protein n=1 Tax=Pseudomonas putida TaxID=303 RepID=A0A2Z4RC31_PSEPU|nr:hypothetical protein DKY63_01675 [Pseudomonas putida]
MECQLQKCRLTHHREQARSYKGKCVVWQITSKSHPIEAPTRYPSSIRPAPQPSYTRASYTRTCGGGDAAGP